MGHHHHARALAQGLAGHDARAHHREMRSSAPPAPCHDLAPERAFVVLVLIVAVSVGMLLWAGCAWL